MLKVIDIKNLTQFVMDTAVIYSKVEEWQAEIDQEV